MFASTLNSNNDQSMRFMSHVSHTKFIDPNLVAVPTQLLTSDQIQNIVHVVNATSNNGCARNYIHGKFGKFISLVKAAYLCRRENGDLNS
jgi:hypothetical protein